MKMINSNELRQGNNVWVTFTEDQVGYGKDYIGEIVAVIERKVRVKGDWHWIELDGISPIPLSPEILEKAGFVFAYKTYQYKDFMFLKNGHLDYKLSEVSQDVKYLHHLQNLVFDLTGQELTINLK